MRQFRASMSRQDGVVSLLGVTLTSFLIIIIVMASTLLMVGELRQSTDAANSIKAFYSAENGTEEALYQVKTALASGDLSTLNGSCLQVVTNNTCMSIKSYDDTIESQGDSDNSLQFDLTNAVTKANYNVDHVDFQWDGKDMHSQQQFSGGTPPIVEMTITNYFPGQQTNIDANHSGTVLLVPSCGSNCTSAPSFAAFDTNQLVAGGTTVCPNSSHPSSSGYCFLKAASAALTVTCHTDSNDAGYRCRARLNKVTDPEKPGYKTVVRLTPRVGAMRFQLQVYDQTQALAQIPMPNAQIDVTAKVGDSLRRLQLEVPIRSAAAPGLSSVLFGDTELCKNFQVLSDNGSYQDVLDSTTSVCPRQ